MNFDVDFTMTIAGSARRSARHIEVINPANGGVFAVAPNCASSTLDEAVESCESAFPGWSALGWSERQAMLLHAADLVSENVEDLARLTTLEQGKPLTAARQEVSRSADWMRSVASLARPGKSHRDADGVDTQFVPLGPACVITAWNVPVTLALRKTAPALLSGNPVVLKPSPYTPLATLKLGELFRSVFPSGVFNVVSGDDALGPLMTSHRAFKKISFTGSTETGRRVMQSAAASLKRVTLELGGNDAAIVLPDVDVEAIMPALFMGAFANSGQICVATKRLYVHDTIYDRLRDCMIEYLRKVKVGNGMDDDTVLGPIQNARQYTRVKALLDDAKCTGLQLYQGSPGPEGGGYFIPPTLVDNPPESSRVVQEEAFGPILPMMRFSAVTDAIARANASEYGLAGAVWSVDLEEAQKVASQLETGTVWINHNLMLRADTPFAGHKQSGFGVEYGIDGLLEFMVPKTIFTKTL